MSKHSGGFVEAVSPPSVVVVVLVGTDVRTKIAPTKLQMCERKGPIYNICFNIYYDISIFTMQVYDVDS